MEQPGEKDARQKGAAEKLDLRAELDRFEMALADLKVQYEQYFLGVVMIAPEKPHADIKRQLRQLINAPFKSSAIAYRLKTLEVRYQTFNTYWQRILKQREEGTYSKDVFKANLRERQALAEARSQTAVGAAERNMQELFNSYRSALEKSTGAKQNLDFKAFQKSLIQRAKDFKAQNGVKKLTFKVVVKDGKVTVQAKAVE